jgi:leader peptidase (prepilin peptidase)/N-methyltransferase
MKADSVLPLELRLLILFVVGVFVGTQINRAIYRLAWFQRNIGPWSPPHPDAAPRQWFDRIPILGWFALRRESVIHGSSFWIRPLLIEIGVGLIFAALYWFEVVHWGVTRVNLGPATLHIQYFSHLVLLVLMFVATFIDFDEQTIPDAITLPGTLLGLIIAAALPESRTLVRIPTPTGFGPDFLHAGSGQAIPSDSGWPEWLNGPPGLAVGIGCFLAWAVAIMPWTWTMRRGLVKAIQYFGGDSGGAGATCYHRRLVAGGRTMGEPFVGTDWHGRRRRNDLGGPHRR